MREKLRTATAGPTLDTCSLRPSFSKPDDFADLVRISEAVECLALSELGPDDLLEVQPEDRVVQSDHTSVLCVSGPFPDDLT